MKSIVAKIEQYCFVTVEFKFFVSQVFWILLNVKGFEWQICMYTSRLGSVLVTVNDKLWKKKKIFEMFLSMLVIARKREVDSSVRSIKLKDCDWIFFKLVEVLEVATGLTYGVDWCFFFQPTDTRRQNKWTLHAEKMQRQELL